MSSPDYLATDGFIFVRPESGTHQHHVLKQKDSSISSVKYAHCDVPTWYGCTDYNEAIAFILLDSCLLSTVEHCQL